MWAFALVVLVVLGALLFLLRGAPELARLEVRDGKLSFVSGRLPGRLLEDFTDVLSDPAIARAEIRIVVDGGRPRVVASGLDDSRIQQLRNVVGPYHTAQLRAGRRPGE